MISLATVPFFLSFKDFISDLDCISEKGVINNDVYEQSSLIIFSGGEDINPQIYGEENLFSHFNTSRDRIELHILERALEDNKKILGVCRGHQLINAYLGGKLIQDLNHSKFYHAGYHNLEILKDDSVVNKFFFDGVNSLHHQGVIKVGKGLTPTSFHNGVFESCENNLIITTQFHPEFMNDSQDFFDYIVEWSKK